jgi:protein-disulfide isomerase
MDKRTAERLKLDIAEGKEAGLTGTPTLFVNGKRLPRVEYFLQAVEKESSRLGLPPLPKPHQGH